MPWPSLRRLGPQDAAAYRDVRLLGLRDHPDSFGAAWEEEADQPLDWFAARLQATATFGAGDETLVGVATLVIPVAAKLRHKAQLAGMFVRVSARGTGLATCLVDHAVDHATGRVEQLLLVVAADNLPARRLYERTGFLAYGREPRAMLLDGRGIDSLLMQRPLPSTPRGSP